MLTIESAETVICGRSGNTVLHGAQLADQANFPQLGMFGSNAAPHDPEVLIA